MIDTFLIISDVGSRFCSTWLILATFWRSPHADTGTFWGYSVTGLGLHVVLDASRWETSTNGTVCVGFHAVVWECVLVNMLQPSKVCGPYRNIVDALIPREAVTATYDLLPFASFCHSVRRFQCRHCESICCSFLKIRRCTDYCRNNASAQPRWDIHQLSWLST